jgi:hypothetical protein
MVADHQGVRHQGGMTSSATLQEPSLVRGTTYWICETFGLLSNTKGQYKMAFRMATLKSTKGGGYHSRIGIPRDIRGDYQALYGRGWEEQFRLPQGHSAQRARVLFSAWQADIESRIATLRAKQRGEGRDLTRREAHALSGEWYSWFVSRHEEAPGEPERWARLGEHVTDAIMDATPWWDDKSPEFEHRDRAKEPEVQDLVHPMLSDKAEIAQFLASKGELLTRDAMTLFLHSLLYEFLAAVDLLKSRAAGDYRPDEHPKGFPEYRKATKVVGRGAGLTATPLFEAYVRDVEPAASTINRWRGVFPALDAHLGVRGVEALSHDEAQQWIDGLVGEKRSKHTVKVVWLSAIRIVLAWAHKKKLVVENPFAEVSVTVKDKAKTRDKEFTAQEQQVILRRHWRLRTRAVRSKQRADGCHGCVPTVVPGLVRLRNCAARTLKSATASSL